MSSRIEFNDGLAGEIAARLIAAVDEIDNRIVAEAMKELYPGHGKITGTLQRAIQATPARLDGNVVRGTVGVAKLRYALRIHRRYKYIHIGLEKVRPDALKIIKRHVNG